MGLRVTLPVIFDLEIRAILCSVAEVNPLAGVSLSPWKRILIAAHEKVGIQRVICASIKEPSSRSIVTKIIWGELINSLVH